MKKILYIFILVIILLIVGCEMESYTYPVGKDSAVVVGDGRFQILSGPTSYSLWDQTKDDALIETIESYYDDEAADKLYVIGDGKYVIVDYVNNSYNVYNEIEINEMSQEELAVFESDKMKKIPEIETEQNSNGILYIDD